MSKPVMLRYADPLNIDNIYYFSDGKYYYPSETGDICDPFTSVAAARADLEDYCYRLDTERDFLCEEVY
jgi:hypothetical protein